jgi:hypothetical protein
MEIIMSKSLYLTDEEIAHLNTLWNDFHGDPIKNNWDDKWRASDWSYEYDDDWSPNSKRKRHEWVPVMLLTHPVYDCKYCGAHKDKAKSEFCDDEIMF